MTTRKANASLAAIPVVTILLGIAFIIVVGIGGVKVIDGSLSYIDYGKQVVVLALGLGLLGVGRGIDATHKP